jgi:hypothetical protein
MMQRRGDGVSRGSAVELGFLLGGDGLEEAEAESSGAAASTATTRGRDGEQLAASTTEAEAD